MNLQFGDDNEHFNNETIEDKLGIIIKKRNQKKSVTFKMEFDEEKKYMEISHLLDGYFMVLFLYMKLITNNNNNLLII